MKRPDNLNDALRQLHHLTMSIAMGLTTYIDDPDDHDPECFEDMKAEALDAHMLVTWVKDNIKELHK